MVPSYDFFLSHNSAEKDWTRTLNEMLRNSGATIFFDEDSIAFGDDIVTAIGEALRRSKHLVFVMSKRSVASRWVELEWTSSLYSDPNAHERKVIPILKEDCDIPFLLQRLRYIDARDKSATEVARILLSSMTQGSQMPDRDTLKQSDVITFGPVPTWSGQYVRRVSDSRLEMHLQHSHSFALYGPRMYGKTSMLQRVAQEERLRGNSVVFLDLQSYGYNIEIEMLLESIGYDIARNLNIDWPRPGLSSAYQVYELLREWVISQEARAILLIDECDVMNFSPAGEGFGNILRAILSSLSSKRLCCVMASFHPPWMMDLTSVSSPWWNLFHWERLPRFNSEQVMEFCSWLGRDAELYAEKLLEVTGGHPAMVARVGYEYASGKKMAEIFADVLNPNGPFYPLASSMINHAMQRLKSWKDTFTRIRDGRTVPNEADRLSLWLMGLIDDPRMNPPVVNGTVFLELLTEQLDENS